MKVKTYLFLANDGICIGPHTSKWTISQGAFALILFPAGKLSLCCLPKMQPSQRLFGLSINGNPFTIPFLCNRFKPPKLRCPNLKCHNQFSSFTCSWKTSCVTTAIVLPSFKFSLGLGGTLYCSSSAPLQWYSYLEVCLWLYTHHLWRTHCNLCQWAVQCY